MYFLIIRKSSQIGACQFLFSAPDFPRKFKQAYAFKLAEGSKLYLKKKKKKKRETNKNKQHKSFWIFFTLFSKPLPW